MLIRKRLPPLSNRLYLWGVSGSHKRTSIVLPLYPRAIRSRIEALETSEPPLDAGS